MEANYQAGPGHKKNDNPRNEGVIGSEVIHQAIDRHNPTVHPGPMNVSSLTLEVKTHAQASSPMVVALVAAFGEPIVVVPLVPIVAEPV